MEYRAEMGAKDDDFRGLGLTSRRNLCLHPEVSFILGTYKSERLIGVRSVRRKRERWWIVDVAI